MSTLHLMQNLLVPPCPLTTWQRKVVFTTAFLVALTRLLALSRSIWDWDEAQFASGLREYDVPSHHPHPPGFPLFILAARLARLVTATDFAALQQVTLLAACALFPLGLTLAREMRFDFAVAYGGSLLFVFLPNIWFYGGTAFSDIAGLAFALSAVMMLLRGGRSTQSLYTGAALLGIAAGFRPQSLLFGCAAFLLAAWLRGPRAWRQWVGAGCITLGIVGVSYVGAAVASSSFEGYRHAVQGVGEWVRTMDAFTAKGRAPLRTLLDDYFLEPMGGRWMPVAISLMAAAGLAAGLVRRRMNVILAAVTFLPFMFFAWLMLDVNSIHRYATSYVFLHAILAAEFLVLIGRPLGRRGLLMSVTLTGLLIAASARSTLPALREVRNSLSPPWAAVTWLREHVPPGGRIWAHGSLAPHVAYALADRDVRVVSGVEAIPVEGTTSEFYASEGRVGGSEAKQFVRSRGRIWDLARQRYFETSVVRIGSLFQFGEGWYGEETDGTQSWRWMGSRSVMRLWPAAPRGRLRLKLSAPDLIAPAIDVRFNGDWVGRVLCTSRPQVYEWVLPSRTGTLNEFVLTSDSTVNLARRNILPDPRELSVRLDSFSWQPVP